jgi:hypothetical protein
MLLLAHIPSGVRIGVEGFVMRLRLLVAFHNSRRLPLVGGLEDSFVGDCFWSV